MQQPRQPLALMLLERHTLAQAPRRFWQLALWRCQRASALLIVERFHVWLDHQPLALLGPPLFLGLGRIESPLLEIRSRLAERSERLLRPGDWNWLWATGELEGLPLFLLGLGKSFLEAGHVVAVQGHGNRLPATLGRVEDAKLHVLREPPGIVVLAGDERRVVGLLDSKALHTLGVARKIENIGGPDPLRPLHFDKRRPQGFCLPRCIAQYLQVKAFPVAALGACGDSRVELSKELGQGGGTLKHELLGHDLAGRHFLYEQPRLERIPGLVADDMSREAGEGNAGFLPRPFELPRIHHGRGVGPESGERVAEERLSPVPGNPPSLHALDFAEDGSDLWRDEHVGHALAVRYLVAIRHLAEPVEHLYPASGLPLEARNDLDDVPRLRVSLSQADVEPFGSQDDSPRKEVRHVGGGRDGLCPHGRPPPPVRVGVAPGGGALPSEGENRLGGLPGRTGQQRRPSLRLYQGPLHQSVSAGPVSVRCPPARDVDREPRICQRADAGKGRSPRLDGREAKQGEGVGVLRRLHRFEGTTPRKKDFVSRDFRVALVLQLKQERSKPGLKPETGRIPGLPSTGNEGCEARAFRGERSLNRGTVLRLAPAILAESEQSHA